MINKKNYNKALNRILAILLVACMSLTASSFLSGDASAAPIGAPFPPNDLTAQGEYGRITLNWQEPYGDIPADYYIIYRYNYYGMQQIGSSSDTVFIDSSVANGGYYSYGVTAVNDHNESDLSNMASAFAGSVPFAPYYLYGDGGDESVYLYWATPDSGGFSIYNYRIYRSEGSGDYAFIGSSGGNYYNDYGLTNGVEYSYQVTAVNELGESDRSGSASATPMTTPSMPGGLRAYYSDASVYLEWEEPQDDGGSGIIEYRVQFRVLNQVWTIDTGSDATEYLVEGLVNGYTYEFSVAAKNEAGTGGYTLSVSCDVFTVPTPVTNLKAYADEESAVLTWSIPGYDGGSPLTHFAVYRSTSADGDYSLIGMTNGTHYVDIGLEGETRYYYRVASGNAIGLGEMSDPVSTVPADTPMPWAAVAIIAAVIAVMAVAVVLQWRKKN